MSDLFDIVATGFGAFSEWRHLLAIFIGLVLGIVIGALPGLGPLLGVVLAIPFTFYLDPISSMALLLGIYQGGSFGGSISAATLGIPGTPLAAATLLDAYPMARKGETSQAVSLATVASSIGGIISAVILILAAPPLAAIAMRFGAAETFSIALLGLTCIVTLSQGSLIKGMLSGLLGLVLAVVGTDPMTGFPRLTFGSTYLDSGITFVALLVGIFAISEVLFQFEQGAVGQRALGRVTATLSAVLTVGRYFLQCLRASVIGTLIGIIPGVSGVTSAFLSYNVAKNMSREPERFGSGIPEGVIASESANNATCGGAMVPMLALGIPGDPIVAALMGGLLIQGLTPGPPLFLYHPEIVSGIFIAFLIGALLILPVGLLCIPAIIFVLRVPRPLLITGVLLLSIVGTYAVQSSIFDLWLMWGFGLLGFGMRKADIPLAPLVIGVVLGPVVEANFRRTIMIMEGDFLTYLLARPIALGILVLSAAFLLWPFAQSWLRRARTTA